LYVVALGVAGDNIGFLYYSTIMFTDLINLFMTFKNKQQKRRRHTRIDRNTCIRKCNYYCL